MTPLVLRKSTGGGDRLPSGDLSAHLLREFEEADMKNNLLNLQSRLKVVTAIDSAVVEQLQYLFLKGAHRKQFFF